MWCRRWVSPVLCSTDRVEPFKASWERRWPRRDGVTRLFWTAIVATPNSPAALELGQFCERFLPVFVRRGIGLSQPLCRSTTCRAVLVPGHERQGQQQFIRYQVGEHHAPVRREQRFIFLR